MEEQSARFFDRNYFEYFTYAVRRVAKFLGMIYSYLFIIIKC